MKTIEELEQRLNIAVDVDGLLSVAEDALAALKESEEAVKRERDNYAEVDKECVQRINENARLRAAIEAATATLRNDLYKTRVANALGILDEALEEE